jgi:hypothetical protein
MVFLTDLGQHSSITWVTPSLCICATVFAQHHQLLVEVHFSRCCIAPSALHTPHASRSPLQ